MRSFFYLARRSFQRYCQSTNQTCLPIGPHKTEAYNGISNPRNATIKKKLATNIKKCSPNHQELSAFSGSLAINICGTSTRFKSLSARARGCATKPPQPSSVSKRLTLCLRLLYGLPNSQDIGKMPPLSGSKRVSPTKSTPQRKGA